VAKHIINPRSGMNIVSEEAVRKLGLETKRHPTPYVAPQILIVLFLIYLFDNIIQLISLRSLWYYGGW
jgi:hypothetical protein